jgi:polysaccharide biosynthesis/export protein
MRTFKQFPPILAALIVAFAGSTAEATILSPADRVSITVVNGDEFTGEQTVRSDGTIKFALIGALKVSGLDESDAQDLLTKALARYIKHPQVSLRLTSAGAITVTVSGAVYSPGPVTIASTNLQNQDATSIRTLVYALRQAGGLKPNADLHIKLLRSGQEQVIDLSGILDGKSFDNAPLLANDTIEVVAADHIDERLLKPSQLTPATIAVSVSGKLPKPGALNLPIGSTLVDGLAAAGAAGGGFNEANREAVLVRKDPISGQLAAKSFAIDGLAGGPTLMQGDTIVVRESGTSNFFDLLKGLVFPFAPILNFLR